MTKYNKAKFKNNVISGFKVFIIKLTGLKDDFRWEYG